MASMRAANSAARAAIVSGRARPTLCGRLCRFHGIADILAIPFRYLADHVTARRINAARVSLVGPRLFAGDEELWSSVEIRHFVDRCRLLVFSLGWQL
jgi:hypothetical protein